MRKGFNKCATNFDVFGNAYKCVQQSGWFLFVGTSILRKENIMVCSEKQKTLSATLCAIASVGKYCTCPLFVGTDTGYFRNVEMLQHLHKQL